MSGVLWHHGIVMLWINQKPELKLQGFHSVVCVRVGGSSANILSVIATQLL